MLKIYVVMNLFKWIGLEIRYVLSEFLLRNKGKGYISHGFNFRNGYININ
jgi:hypothetical protein